MKHSHYLTLDIDDESNVIVKKVKFNIQAKNIYNSESCSICLSDFKANEKNEVSLLECGPIFLNIQII